LFKIDIVIIIIIIILNYKYSPIEIKRMWNVKSKVTQGIIWAIGTNSKSLRQYLSHIAGNQGTTQNSPYWTLHTYCRKS